MFTVTSTSERVNSVGGLALVGEMFKRFDLGSGLAVREEGRRSDRVTDSDTATMMMGLQAQGRNDFEDIELFRDDPMFSTALNLPKVLSAVSLRQRLDDLAEDASALPRLKEANLRFLSQAEFGTVTTPFSCYIPVDADVSPFDNSKSSKEGVGRTYKGMDGYAPLFAYVGTEGWLLDLELRPGVQHSQKEAPEFFEGCVAKLRDLGLLDRCLFRLDSGHDAKETIDVLHGQCDFIVKRNLRREFREWWLQHARRLGTATTPREGKTVYVGTVEHLRPGGDEARPTVTVVFRVTVRTSDAEGQPFLLEQIDVDTWWTSLGESPETVIGLYEAHGTSEQYHSELKTDMDLERLPSGTFATNELVLHLGMLAYNTLRFIDQAFLKNRELMPIKKNVMRRRVGSVIRDVVFTGCKLVRHANRWIIRIWERNPWLPAFQAVYRAIAVT
ncbi:MAG: IS1380 family transposase [Planctomycetes bacterium]|nr:IS1380 family transposase [Planctomycetota bacterium]